MQDIGLEFCLIMNIVHVNFRKFHQFAIFIIVIRPFLDFVHFTIKHYTFVICSLYTLKNPTCIAQV